MACDLTGLEVAALMIDGLNAADQMITVALVITADGTNVLVGLRLGDTENKMVLASAPPARFDIRAFRGRR